MAISTNPKPTIYRKLCENTGPGVCCGTDFIVADISVKCERIAFILFFASYLAQSCIENRCLVGADPVSLLAFACIPRVDIHNFMCNFSNK